MRIQRNAAARLLPRLRVLSRYIRPATGETRSHTSGFSEPVLYPTELRGPVQRGREMGLRCPVAGAIGSAHAQPAAENTPQAPAENVSSTWNCLQLCCRSNRLQSRRRIMIPLTRTHAGSNSDASTGNHQNPRTSLAARSNQSS